MQSSQLPPPSNIPGPKRTGPPPRVAGGKPGAKPGPPRPKAPTPMGGRPMMPISSLIQAPTFTDPEGASNVEEGIKNEEIQAENRDQEVKVEEKIEDDVKETKHNSSEPKSAKGVEPQQDDELLQVRKDHHVNGLLINQGKNDDEEDSKPITRSQDNQIKDELSSPNKIISKAVEEDHHNIKANEEENEDKQKNSSNNDADSNEEKPPMFGQPGPFRKEQKGTQNSEDNHFELPPSRKVERPNKAPQNGPFSKAKQGPFPNSRQYEVKEDEDQEDTRDGDQNPSPVVQRVESSGKPERISSQEDQRDYETYEKPSMPMFFKPKTAVKHEDIGDSTNDIIHRHSVKEFEHEREDISLVIKLKTLEIELEKERREKVALMSDQGRLLEENATLKEQLLEATSKSASHTEQGINPKDKDLLRKDEEIKRLKSELKSTMEGSRYVTEHSNRVISESAKFKEEAETMILNLEREKEELHQKFVAFKKQVQEEYTSKIIALQEREKYLSEKVTEYQKDISRYQSDLNQRSQTIKKLTFVNNEVGSAISQWPAFNEILTQVHAHSKLIEESRFQIASPVKATSPVRVKNSPIRIQQAGFKEVLSASHQDHVQFEDIEVESKDHNIAEPHYHSEQNSPFINNISENKQYLDISAQRKSVNDEKASNTPETHAEDTSQTLYEQEKPEEVHTKHESDPFQNSEPVEPMDNGWGIEEAPLVEDDKQETLEINQENEQPVEHEKIEDKVETQLVQEPEVVEPLDNGWGIEETPLVEEQRPETHEYQYHEPIEQEKHLDNGWEIEETPLVEEEKQETQEGQYQYQYEQQAEYQNIEEQREYQQEQRQFEQIEPLENGWGIEETPLVEEEKQETQEGQYQYEQPVEYQNTGYQQDAQEYREEEAAPTLEVHYEEARPAVTYQEEPQEQKGYYDEAQIHTGYQQQVYYNQSEQSGNNQNVSETVATSQLTAVPAYRMPQKKKKAAPAKKPVVGFRPAAMPDNMPDQPQALVVEEQSNNTSENQHVETQSYHQEEVIHYEPVQQDFEMIQSGPVVHENIPEVESKPPQFVPFGRTPLTQAKKGGKAQPKAPRPNMFAPAKVMQYQYPQDQGNGVYQEPEPHHDQTSTTEAAPVYSQEEKIEEPPLDIGTHNEAGHEDNYGKNEINGHTQAPPTQGKKIKTNKIIKKKQPATGSIFS